MHVLQVVLQVLQDINQLFSLFVVDAHINAVHVLVVFYVLLAVVDTIYQELHV